MTQASRRPGKLTPVLPARVTAAELREVRMRLLRAELAALQAVRRALDDRPDLPGASAWTLTAALDDERRDEARKLLERLGRVQLAETA